MAFVEPALIQPNPTTVEPSLEIPQPEEAEVPENDPRLPRVVHVAVAISYCAISFLLVKLLRFVMITFVPASSIRGVPPTLLPGLRPPILVTPVPELQIKFWVLVYPVTREPSRLLP
jgi:hypothetical protein